MGQLLSYKITMAGNFLEKKAKSGILGELEISGLLVLGDLAADT